MIATIITSTTSLSTKKAKQWFEKNEIPYVERNIVKEPLTIGELHNILRMTIEGTDEIIATRSKTFQELNGHLDDLPLTELFQLIHDHPALVKSPIIMDEKRLQVGFMQMKFVNLSQGKHVNTNG